MVHFNHEKEITPQAIQAIDRLINAGAILCNQTPLIKGVNDNPKILANLLNKLSFIGATPYYIFQSRPTIGNKTYAVPLEEGYRIFEEAKMSLSGLAKRAKFVMSHATGKIEILGIDNSFVYMKYHRTPDLKVAEVMKFERNPEGYWLEDFKPVSP
jgi:L-lysine 2,3-aminomutase